MELRHETMTVEEYKRRWMSGHECPAVKEAEVSGALLDVGVQSTPFGSFAVTINVVSKAVAS
jgi:hypothetical protein